MDDLLLNFRLNIPLYEPHPASHHTSAVPYLSPSLSAAKHVYVRRDGTNSPLQRPYSGPHTVLTPGYKTFLIYIGIHAECISVDRIKPAFFFIHFNRSYWLNLLNASVVSSLHNLGCIHLSQVILYYCPGFNSPNATPCNFFILGLMAAGSAKSHFEMWGNAV